MLTIFLILGLMPVLVFIELSAQRWLSKNAAEKHDLEWKLYRQRIELSAQRWSFKNAAEKHDLEWELYQQRWD